MGLERQIKVQYPSNGSLIGYRVIVHCYILKFRVTDHSWQLNHPECAHNTILSSVAELTDRTIVHAPPSAAPLVWVVECSADALGEGDFISSFLVGWVSTAPWFWPSLCFLAASNSSSNWSSSNDFLQQLPQQPAVLEESPRPPKRSTYVKDVSNTRDE